MGTHMNRADRLQPMASRCEVKRLDRSEAILPGNLQSATSVFSVRDHAYLVHDAQEVEEEGQNEEIFDTAEIVCYVSRGFSPFRWKNVLILFCSDSSSAD